MMCRRKSVTVIECDLKTRTGYLKESTRQWSSVWWTDCRECCLPCGLSAVNTLQAANTIIQPLSKYKLSMLSYRQVDKPAPTTGSPWTARTTFIDPSLHRKGWTPKGSPSFGVTVCVIAKGMITWKIKIFLSRIREYTQQLHWHVVRKINVLFYDKHSF